ncbi:phosphatidylinositol N-acetylglucosaminyltransferase subunit H-like isoform X1 [Centruroides sculpturatus]|uniref:phosphatidylinositol N-acetylglucosaminyltransferase subunit H-like isoform X1 n=1 Tax=Centruroides sculpturatus TaxID=218467 RepID=UPI000C6D6BF0|nr:phosphatidylinositol N-acetylglucosaminyltransferase subunit H-like isoform X1 [Centruroides sculpturatus]
MTGQRSKLFSCVVNNGKIQTDTCEDKPRKHSLVTSKECQDIFGQKLLFQAIKHDSTSFCNEYIIERSAFSVRRWVFLTLLFSVLALQYEVYTRDTSLLGIILILLCVILIAKLHLKVKQESLLVITSIGLQFTTTFVTGRQNSKFIHQCHIKDVVINEGITMHRVIFYLAVLLKDASQPLGIGKILPLFQHTFPRLECLEQIYTGIHISLFGNYSNR